MNRLKALHDDVKTSYEHGDYQTATQAYQDWQRMTADDQHLRDDDQKDDYQRGYQRAKQDYQAQHKFQNFSTNLINLVNLLSRNQAIEVSKFIDGYEAYRSEINQES